MCIFNAKEIFLMSIRFYLVRLIDLFGNKIINLRINGTGADNTKNFDKKYSQTWDSFGLERSFFDKADNKN
jgi:hypothetical protein